MAEGRVVVVDVRDAASYAQGHIPGAWLIPVDTTAQRTAELTAREREVAELIAAGLSNPQIAEALVVSIRTVESHINKLMKKIGARERSDVRQYLIREGLTQAWS